MRKKTRHEGGFFIYLFRRYLAFFFLNRLDLGDHCLWVLVELTFATAAAEADGQCRAGLSGLAVKDAGTCFGLGDLFHVFSRVLFKLALAVLAAEFDFVVRGLRFIHRAAADRAFIIEERFLRFGGLCDAEERGQDDEANERGPFFHIEFLLS